MHRSVGTTAAELGPDGRAWKALFARTSANYDSLSDDILRPLVRVPTHPLRLARFGMPSLLPATLIARLFATEQDRALWGGVAAHAFQPLHRPLASAIGLGILTAGHRHGWTVAAGGSRSITDGLALALGEHAGKIETGVRVTSAGDLPPADVTLFDIAPSAVAAILGDRLPARVARAYRRFRHGPGAFKVDFAVEGRVPWASEPARRAGTVHLGGTFAEVVATERAINAGRMPERPFVLVGQQYLADPQRSVRDVHPVWSYAHVPHGYTGDATQAIIDQFECHQTTLCLGAESSGAGRFEDGVGLSDGGGRVLGGVVPRFVGDLVLAAACSGRVGGCAAAPGSMPSGCFGSVL